MQAEDVLQEVIYLNPLKMTQSFYFPAHLMHRILISAKSVRKSPSNYSAHISSVICDT